MANTKSAIKRVRRISRQTQVNKSRKSKFRNALKKMNSLIEKKDKKRSTCLFAQTKFRIDENCKDRCGKEEKCIKKCVKNYKKNKFFLTTSSS